MKLIVAFVIAFSSLSLLGCVEANNIMGNATVIDGDTIDIHDIRIRLHGIDAPEGSQPCYDETGQRYRCGRDATFALDDAIGNREVSCIERDVDRYGRIVAVCSVGSVDLNEFLVRSGFAVAYRKYSGDYISAERDARSARRGLWRGQFEMPWDWRHNN